MAVMPQLAIDEPLDGTLDQRLLRALRGAQECREAAQLGAPVVEQILVEDQQSRVRSRVGQRGVRVGEPELLGVGKVQREFCRTAS